VTEQASTASNSPQRAVEVEVFSDFCCPWCLIGGKNLDDAIASLEGTLDIRTVHRAFELDLAAPADGVDIRQKLMEKHGVRAEDVWPSIESTARASGIDLNLSRQPMAYPTLGAHTLVRLAAGKGTARQLSRAIAEAYFLDGVSIADENILADIAARHGFTHDEAISLLRDPEALARTRAEAQESMRRGVRSVPTIVVAGKAALSSSQPVEQIRQALLERST
jgi:predicted DsbA family dithiol-disulfide isomerase